MYVLSREDYEMKQKINRLKLAKNPVVIWDKSNPEQPKIAEINAARDLRVRLTRRRNSAQARRPVKHRKVDNVILQSLVRGSITVLRTTAHRSKKMAYTVGQSRAALVNVTDDTPVTVALLGGDGNMQEYEPDEAELLGTATDDIFVINVPVVG